ncbi:hypothetical protein CPT75_03430 [Butyrivibrio fibrisolvens]|uniref:Uncharacterized protein n=1 Tax=Butyrivibrio fibrisolvens TaxID=831 RepID=A0A317FX59_BUTFI|nr:hypothetical protein CPT75_03430 [Butyrivibrio fibrisolvens]
MYDNIVAEIGHDFTKTVRNSQISDIDRSWIHFVYGSSKDTDDVLSYKYMLANAELENRIHDCRNIRL